MKVQRIPTGILGLDSRIEGGFPVNSTIVMLSDPNNYNEPFMQQFVYQALLDGFPALYIAVARSPEEIMTSMRTQGMDVDRYSAEKRFVIVDFYSRVNFLDEGEEDLPQVEDNIVSIQNIDDPEMVLMAINAGLGTLGDLSNIRMVVDSTPEILSGLGLIEFLRFWRTVGNNLSRYDLNVFYNFPSGIKDDFFRAASHHAGVLLRLMNDHDGMTFRTHLYIDKMRFTKLESAVLQMSIEGNRVKTISYDKIR